MICVSQISAIVGFFVIIGMLAIPQIRALFLANKWLYLIIALLFLIGVLGVC